jgi:hypothetical protein
MTPYIYIGVTILIIQCQILGRSTSVYDQVLQQTFKAVTLKTFRWEKEIELNRSLHGPLQ